MKSAAMLFVLLGLTGAECGLSPVLQLVSNLQKVAGLGGWLIN